MPGETRDELLAVVERLQAMAPGDDKALPGWKAIRAGAPKVWENVKPVLHSIVSEGIKKALGL